ncbi:hypothetical protein BAMY6639_09100 [Bacillus amyloliquefaciens UMAF6639]|nr:hypothetical protein BAMY6639_09100 [Bacillus amyloliquefaciens UMAF6639]
MVFSNRPFCGTKKAFCKGLTACFAVSRNYITFSSGDR